MIGPSTRTTNPPPESTPLVESPERGVVARLLILLLAVYRATISQALPPSCRFKPSCAAYAQEAIATHGALRGAWLAARRLGRCHPWGGSGWDPVPLRGRR